MIAGWRTEETTEDARPEPSARAAAGWSTVEPLLVNDPGSPTRYCQTVAVSTLDKFSRLTVLLSANGPKLEGDTASELDSDAEVEGVVAEPIEHRHGVD